MSDLHIENILPPARFPDGVPTAGPMEDRDIDAVFRHLSAVAGRFVPHDDALLVLNGGFAGGNGSPAADATELVTDAHESPEGFRAWMRAPLRVGDAVAGSVAWLSRRPVPYTICDLALLAAVADHVGLVLLAREHATAAAVERANAAGLDASAELLRELATVLDIRRVFPRVSEIAQRVLPHDRLTMSFHGADGDVVQTASSENGEPPFRIQVDPGVLARSFVLLPELGLDYLESIGHPLEARQFLSRTGYGSFLAVNVHARDQRMGLEFWAKEPNAFTMKDVPIAKRIADHVALAVSHEQLAEAARQVGEARMRARQLEAHVKTLSAELAAKRGYARAVGRSAAWRATLRAAVQVAATDTTVLLTGESGTGKEVVARLIHQASSRRDGPFVAVNCAALPEPLLESELFGYERGAFTGAQQSKPGQIEMAAHGVLLLDEVSEMSLGAQAKLLRVLQEREFQRLGGTRPRPADVHVIASTNVDLREAMERGQFRRDLYYRLCVFTIALPPLRERPDDIVPLSEAFLEELGARCGWPTPILSPAARKILLAYRWPGNVRELRNVLERAAILSNGAPITPEHLSLDGDEGPVVPATTNLGALERWTIERVLRETAGNKSRAAQRLGLTRMQLYVRLRRHQLA